MNGRRNIIEWKPLTFNRPGLRKLGRIAGSYGIVSVVCFVTNNILLIWLDSLGRPLWLTLVISATTMILLGFVLQSNFTFEAPLNWPAFGRYTLMMLPNIPFAYGLLWVLNKAMAVPMYFAAPAATTIMLLWNAAGSTWALRKRSKET
jgi:putative flippase GtrA